MNEAETAEARAKGRQRKARHEADRQLRADLQQVLEGEAGLRVFAWLIYTRCRLTRVYVAPLAPEAAQFEAGIRSVGGHILEDVLRMVDAETARRLFVAAAELQLLPRQDHHNETAAKAEEKDHDD